MRAAGFEQLNHLSGNIGYLDIRSFQKAGATITAAVLHYFSGTEGLLIDLRRNQGGDSAAASLLASHFFDTELVHLDAEYWTDSRRQRAFAVPTLPGFRYVGPPVYVLLGKHSSPVSIGFARMLRAAGRITIVGESPASGMASPDLPVDEDTALAAAHCAALKPVPSVA
ncbi:MAG: S41 family peptidase [Gemmatimonadaceae bacterium]